VNIYIITGSMRGNEAIPLEVIEPLYRALRHSVAILPGQSYGLVGTI
jgi:hypothetical protein